MKLKHYLILGLALLGVVYLYHMYTSHKGAKMFPGLTGQ